MALYYLLPGAVYCNRSAVISLCSVQALWLNFSMRPAIALFTVVLLVGCAGEPKHATWSNATGSEQHERLMWQAVRENDWNNFERRLSPTFVGVSPDGQTLDRAGWIALWKGAQVKEVVLGDCAVQPEGANMKVACVIHFQGRTDVSDPAGLRTLSIWQQAKRGWMLTATSITPIRKQSE